MRNVMRRIGQLILSNVAVTVLLFALAGTVNWPYAWIYVAYLWVY